MRRRSLVLLGAAAFLLSACEIRSEVVVTINEDGSGTFELLIADDQGGQFRLAAAGTSAFAPPIVREERDLPEPPARPDARIFARDRFLALLDDYLARFYAQIKSVVVEEAPVLDPAVTTVFESSDDWESTIESEEWMAFLEEDLDEFVDYEALALEDLDFEDGFEDDFSEWEDEFVDWGDEFGDEYYGDEYDEYYDEYYDEEEFYDDEEEFYDDEEPVDGGEDDYYDEEDPYYEEPPPDDGGGGDTGGEDFYLAAPKEGITAALANTPFESLEGLLPAGWEAQPYNEDGFTGGVLSYDFKDLRQLDRAIKQLNAAVADDTWPFDGFTLRREGEEYLFEIQPKDRTPSGGEKAKAEFDALKKRVDTRITLRTPAKANLQPQFRRAEGRLQESFLRAERGAFDSTTVLMPMEGGKPISARSEVPEGAPDEGGDDDGGSAALGLLLIGVALALGAGAVIFGLMRRRAALAGAGGPVDPGPSEGWTGPPPGPPSAPPPDPPPPQPPPQPPPNPPPP